MSDIKNSKSLDDLLNSYTSEFDKRKKETAVILAAGHGKRIKSHKSKMLHEIWGEPTVCRVYDACSEGLGDSNNIVVVGIKAEDVIATIGKRENGIFVNQEEQNGTGHAVQVALDKIDMDDYDGVVYVFPGDMGLINKSAVEYFKEEFKKSNNDMMVLTGLYDGDYHENYYGRIVRIKKTDVEGNKSDDAGRVVKIMEHKDILSLENNEEYIIEFNGRKYSYTKEELLKNVEFNSGVFAFTYKYLAELIGKIKSDNVQKEIYLTDLIYLFNQKGLTVGAVSPKQQHVIMGFNNKSVLKEMEKIARAHIYNQLKDIITIEDEDDFFIADDVVKRIIELDAKGNLLDIYVGTGVHIGRRVKVNFGNRFERGAWVENNIVLGEDVVVGEYVELSCYDNQTLQIGDNVEILWGDIIKGNVVIGKNSRIESGVIITGSDEEPVKIGENVILKGSSYIYGTTIEDNILIYHSVLVRKNVVNPNKDREQFKVGFYIPEVIGEEGIKDLK